MQSQRQLTEAKHFYKESFIDGTYLYCINTAKYISISNCMIFVYSSKEDFLKFPDKPIKFFNMFNATLQITENRLIIRENEKLLKLSHFDIGFIRQLYNVIQSNKMLAITDIFPKKFIHKQVNVD